MRDFFRRFLLRRAWLQAPRSAGARNLFARLRLEELENRLVPAAPTLKPIGDITLPAGQTFQVPLDGNDTDGDPLTFTATSSNSSVTVQLAPSTNHSLKIHVKGGDQSATPPADNLPFEGDIVLQLFEDLTPQTTAKIIDLVNSHFYDGLTFHRIVQDFVAQGGDPAGDGSGGPGFTFDDEFNRNLTFDGFGQLAMANSGDDTNGSQFFITDVDLSLSNVAKLPPRHLNFEHTIFGQLIEGADVFTKLIATKVSGSTPVSDAIMTSVQVIDGKDNGVLRVSAPEGFVGTSDITVTVSDGHGGTTTRTFKATVSTDANNDKPFLGQIPPLGTTVNKPVSVILPWTDIDHDAVSFTKSNVLPATATVTVDADTGRLTVTPPTGYVGDIFVRVGVKDKTHAFDTELVKITVAANAAPTATTPSTVNAFKNADAAIVLTGNDGDANVPQQLSFIITDLPDHGTLRDAAGNVVAVDTPLVGRDLTSLGLTYTPTAGYTGPDSFKFKVTDGGGTDSGGDDTSDEATVTLDVANVTANPKITVNAAKRLTVQGGTGVDTVRVVKSVDGTRWIVTLNNQPPQTFLVADVTSLRILGSGGNDTVFIGDAVTIPATVLGGGGDDAITGGAGADSLDGGAGNDTIFAGAGNDTVLGQAGNDILVGADGNDALTGAAGNDTMDGGKGTDKITGNGGDDSLFGGIGKDTLTGGPGADRFGSGEGSDFPPDQQDVRDFVTNVDKEPDNSEEQAFTDSVPLGIHTWELPGAPNIFSQSTGFDHQTGDLDYSAYTSPPTYGPHHPFVPGTTPRPTGVYTVAQADEDLVHNLEHGHIWISYRADLITPDDLAALQELVKSFGPENGVILTPREANPTLLTIASWGHLTEQTTLDLAAIRTFILTNRGFAREGFITP